MLKCRKMRYVVTVRRGSMKKRSHEVQSMNELINWVNE